MNSIDIWQDVDRMRFFESAILIDCKRRAQGKPLITKLNTENPYETRLRGFLDDFALVAAGAGGKHNVSAVCIELPEGENHGILRLAKNSTPTGEEKARLQSLLDSVRHTEIDAKVYLAMRQTVLEEIYSICGRRIIKKISKMSSAFLQAGISHHSHRRASPSSLQYDSTEEEFSMLQQMNNQYTTRKLDNVELESWFSRLLETLNSGVSDSNSQICGLMRLTYEVSRADGFKLLIEKKVTALSTAATKKLIDRDVLNLVERVGQVAKFYRAATTFVKFGREMALQGRDITIMSLKSWTIAVPELEGRNVILVKQRGGSTYRKLNTAQITGMINRWERYILHAEMQLVIFYTENPQYRPYINFIGCDKLACYLCYRFLYHLGRFVVSGCHQSLYSKWTLPKNVKFNSMSEALAFKNALSNLSDDMQCIIHRYKNGIPRFSQGNESMANLSRVSAYTRVQPDKIMVQDTAYADSNEPQLLLEGDHEPLDEHATSKVYADISDEDDMPMVDSAMASIPIEKPSVCNPSKSRLRTLPNSQEEARSERSLRRGVEWDAAGCNREKHQNRSIRVKKITEKRPKYKRKQRGSTGKHEPINFGVLVTNPRNRVVTEDTNCGCFGNCAVS